MRYLIDYFLKTLACTVLIMSIGCNEKKKIINLISSPSTESNQDRLKFSSISNLDSLCGFRNLKLNSNLTEFDLSDFDMVQTENGEYKHYYTWFQTKDVYYASNNIKGIELFFYKDKLVGIKLKFNNAQSLMSDLKTAFGNPTFSEIPVDFKTILKRNRIDWQNYNQFPDISRILFEDDSHPLKLIYNSKICEIETGNKGFCDPQAPRNPTSNEEKRNILRNISLKYVEAKALPLKANYYWNSNLIELQYYSKFIFRLPALTFIQGYDPEFNASCTYRFNYVDSFPSSVLSPRYNYEFGIQEEDVYVTFFYRPTSTARSWEERYESTNKKELDKKRDYYQKQNDSLNKEKSLKDL